MSSPRTRRGPDMNDHLDPIFREALAPFAPKRAPSEIPESELIAADLAYIASQKERMQRRLEETAALERAYNQRRGML